MHPYGSMRSHGAGTLRADHTDATVTLAGWVSRRRDHGGVAFLDLRDASGTCQVVADPSASAALAAAHEVRPEWVLQIHGTVRRRPEGMENPSLATGEVEVAASSVTVLSPAETPPFPLEGGVEADETLRVRHRYLDLRRETPAHGLRLRAQITSLIRRVMESHGFIDVETPMLTRSTPEGARDFLVPTRAGDGVAYALPQSPQLFKQLLMVAGVERYYQLARCFRDEDLRADRQPEFTQLDVEASFIDEEDLYALFEELFATLWREILDVELATPFPRLSYDEAMRRFGTDKPDTRFGLELVDLAAVFADTEVGVFRGALDAGGVVVAVTLPGGAALTRKQLDDWVDWAKGRRAKGLAWGAVEDGEDGPTLRSPLTKFMSAAEVDALLRATGAGVGDLIFFGAGPATFTRELMGALRVALAQDRGLIGPGSPAEGRWDFLWVTDWPLFEWSPDEARWDPLHHPFTAPREQDLPHLTDDPGAVAARGYDLVLNGTELGGGSIRIHHPGVQQQVFDVLGITPEEAQEKFGFLLRGLAHGAPPHGGIAFGLDRMVMLMAGAASIRDVIAFPKLARGYDPMTDAPARVDDAQLREVGLRRLPPQ